MIENTLLSWSVTVSLFFGLVYLSDRFHKQIQTRLDYLFDGKENQEKLAWLDKNIKNK
jgi:hypothetical protein